MEPEAIVACNFAVCRFCLQSKESGLTAIYEKVTGSIVGVEAALKNTLVLLQIPISQNDDYPNYICNVCRFLLSSIQHFRNTVKQSQCVLDRAKVLKQSAQIKSEPSPPREASPEPVVEKLAESEGGEEAIDEALEAVGSIVDEILIDQKDEIVEREVREILVYQRHEAGDIEVEVEMGDESPAQIDEEAEDNDDVEHAEIYAESAGQIEDVLFSDAEGFLKEEIVEQIAGEVEPSESNYTDKEFVQSEDEQSSAAEEDKNEVFTDEELEQESIPDSAPSQSEYQEEEYLDEQDEQHSEQAKKRIANKQCPICGATTTAMAVHMRMHTNTRPFKCDICRKGFYTSHKLRTHMDCVHKGKRVFQCQVCQKSFGVKKTLNTHLLTHLSDAEKSFNCPLCPKSFLFRWALVKHERIHTGEKPFVCTLDGCGKKFASSSNLRQHQRTNVHWTPQLLTCPECGKVFQSKSSLRTHQKTTHEKSGANSVSKTE